MRVIVYWKHKLWTVVDDLLELGSNGSGNHPVIFIADVISCLFLGTEWGQWHAEDRITGCSWWSLSDVWYKWRLYAKGKVEVPPLFHPYPPSYYILVHLTITIKSCLIVNYYIVIENVYKIQINKPCSKLLFSQKISQNFISFHFYTT
jgi:hypothetical protein